MKKEISRWAFTQTTAEVVCPRCSSQPGFDCTTPKGRKVFTPHAERCTLYRQKIGIEEFKKRHSAKVIQGSDFISYLKTKLNKKKVG